MRTVDIRRTIPAPIHDVFDWLTDATNYSRVPVVHRVTLVRPGDLNGHGVGAVRRVQTPLLSLTEHIVDYRPPVLMGYRITESWPLLHHEKGYIAFREAPRGTEVHWYTRYEAAAGWGLTLALQPVIYAGFDIVLRTAARELRTCG
ncbi:SRPBCC family protein [Nocardia goodfellowii]